jgi:hypothetical protein
MDKIRLVLTIITIVIVVVPLVGTVLANQGNLLGLVFPSELNDLADDLIGGDDGPGLEPPTMVGEPEYDEATGTFSVSFQFKNSFPLDITIKSLSGNIECVEHGFPLGNASLSEPVDIPAGETGTLTVMGKWTDAAKSHCQNEHMDEEFVDVVLAGFAVDISGIQIELDEGDMGQMQVPNPAYME